MITSLESEFDITVETVIRSENHEGLRDLWNVLAYSSRNNLSKASNHLLLIIFELP